MKQVVRDVAVQRFEKGVMAIILTKAEAKLTFICEHCGKRSPAKPWPTGWFQCGRSRKVLISDLRTHENRAAWCSQNCYNADRMVHGNPMPWEIKRLFEREN